MKGDVSAPRGFTDKKFNKWYKEFPKSQEPVPHSKSELEVIELKAEAKKCLDADAATFNLKQSKIGRSDYSWMKTVLSKGTAADKVAAGTVLIQDNPKYNLARLTNLVSMVKVSKKKQCTMIIDTLQELFLSDMLHPECKLMKFEEQDFNVLSDKLYTENPMKRRQLLAHWYFEDQLKLCYAQFIEALNSVAHDTVDANKEKAITAMYRLLAKNAEQEQQLLIHIVNKIGDPSSKVASKTIFCLGQLLNEHPNMKQVVLNEIEKLLFRKNVAQKAQYYGVCLLTQFLLDQECKDIANNLINVYFSFFKSCLKKGEVDSRMMGALLMGVNRAYPFSEMDSNQLQEHIDTVYKVVHVGSFNVSLNALSLLHQVIGKESKQSDRFYCAFYKKLLDPQLGTTTHQAMFLSLLFKVLKKDTDATRTKAFIKRILQISLYFPVNITCAMLYMISQVLKIRKGLYIGVLPQTDFSESDPQEQEQILNNSVKDEAIKSEEKQDAGGIGSETNTIILTNMKVNPLKVLEEKDEEGVKIKPENIKNYDPNHRNPLHSRANCSFYGELVALSSHFHPTIVLFANTIIQGKPISYSGDPLQDFTLIRFLDRYVFKNPKKLEDQKIFTKSNNPLAKRATYIPKGIRSVPVNSATYLNESEDRIPADELFLYRFLKSRDIRPKSEGDDDESDAESVNSDDFNAMLDGLREDEDFDELDIAGDISASKKRRKKGEEENSEESDSGDEHSDDSDAELLAEGDSDIDEDEMLDDDELQEMNEDNLDGVDDDDLSDIDFSDEDEGDTQVKNFQNKKRTFDTDVFASAEDFADILEGEGNSTFKHGSANAMNNADKAAVKQLDWEDKRNRWIKGYNKTVGKKRSGGGGGAHKKGAKKFKRR